jgi:hypothetical protein
MPVILPVAAGKGKPWLFSETAGRPNERFFLTSENHSID